jgi:hypothetical protein
VDGGVAVADGRGDTEWLGEGLTGEAVGVGSGKTTRDGTQSRTARTRARITTARRASRANAATLYASRRSCRPSQSQ